MFNLFNRPSKRKPEIVDVNAEIQRISKYMVEYDERVGLISEDKILITEKDYRAIWYGIGQVINDSVKNHNLDKMQSFQIISRFQNLANRIIDKLYDIDWVY